MNDGLFEFSEERTPLPNVNATGVDSSVAPSPCLVLSVEDDNAYQEALVAGLSGFSVDGREIQVLTAQSAKEASRIVAENSHIAVILLGVIMETDDAGIRLVKTIRDVIGNANVRIVMLTGQPGVAPRMASMLNLDINEYWHKPDLTLEKLQVVAVSNIRSWSALVELEKARHGLQLLVDAASEWSNYRDLRSFSNSVLASIGRLMGTGHGGLICLNQGEDRAPCRIVASSGAFSDARDVDLGDFLAGPAVSRAP